MKKILFSAIGGTDPISNFRDGSMLHICRVFKPDLVYMYLSKEMCEFHEKDNRYVYCVEKLSELLDHPIEVRLIERPDLVKVFDFDYFYQEFDACIHEIKKEEQGDILLNVSSGTPAMKNALNILTELSDLKLTAIQVVTPEGKINPHEENRVDYDVETYWELNRDNDETDFVDRCTILENKNQMALFAVNNIKKYIDAYDYVAAVKLAESIPDFLAENCFKLLKIACARLRLDKSEFGKLKGNEYNFLPVQSSDQRDIVEYILMLQIKVKKEEYADFLRALTPVFFELCKMAVDNEGVLRLSELTYIDRNTSAMRWKVNLEQENVQVFNLLNNAYSAFNGGNVYSDHLIELIRFAGRNERIKNAFVEFRQIERDVRNAAAHNMIAVTNDWIEHECNFRAEQIMTKLKNLVSLAGIKMDKEKWTSYDLMNEKIKESLENYF